MENAVKHPEVLLRLDTLEGYGIYDKVNNCFIGIVKYKNTYDYQTREYKRVLSKNFKAVWAKPNHASSAFKLHTGTSIKDVSDKYEIRPK